MLRLEAPIHPSYLGCLYGFEDVLGCFKDLEIACLLKEGRIASIHRDAE
jgi:hypothetical protein